MYAGNKRVQSGGKGMVNLLHKWLSMNAKQSQGLKPLIFTANFGTAEVEPLHKASQSGFSARRDEFSRAMTRNWFMQPVQGTPG
jgi:hypothetical protein